MKLPSLATLLRPPVQTLPLFPHLLLPLLLLALLACATLFAHSDVNAALLWSQCHARERLPLLTDARFVPSWLATPACFLVSFFAEALDAARSRAAVAELLAGVGALMSVATAESARACNERVASRVGRGVIARPTGWWLLFNLIGGALVW